jgi:hypothetical protein
MMAAVNLWLSDSPRLKALGDRLYAKHARMLPVGSNNPHPIAVYAAVTVFGLDESRRKLARGI